MKIPLTIQLQRWSQSLRLGPDNSANYNQSLMNRRQCPLNYLVDMFVIPADIRCFVLLCTETDANTLCGKQLPRRCGDATRIAMATGTSASATKITCAIKCFNNMYYLFLQLRDDRVYFKNQLSILGDNFETVVQTP